MRTIRNTRITNNKIWYGKNRQCKKTKGGFCILQGVTNMQLKRTAEALLSYIVKFSLSVCRVSVCEYVRPE